MSNFIHIVLSVNIFINIHMYLYIKSLNKSPLSFLLSVSPHVEGSSWELFQHKQTYLVVCIQQAQNIF